MEMRRTAWCGVGLLALAMAGCGLFKKDATTGKAAAPAGQAKIGAAPMSYSSANKGLPSGRIWKSMVAFGDVNGDGLPDVGLVSRLADGPWIFINNGDGSWREAANGLPREPYCGGGMDFMDVNKDGLMDVAIADHCKGVFVYLGDGKGNWRTASSGLPTIGAEDVSLGDFNNDGCVDLASIAAAEEGVRAFTGNCKGVWKESSDGLALTDWGNSIEIREINGDGNLDVVAAYAAGPRVWLGDGKGKWQEASQGLPAPEIRGLYWGVDVGDVNNDGRPDIVAGSQMPPLPEGCGAPGAAVCAGGGVEVFLQQADGSWVFANEGFLPMNTLGVAIGDLNNDGKADVVAAGKRALDEIGGVYGVFTYLGDGTGKWTPVIAEGLPQTGRERTWGVGLADINKDGVLDIGVAFGDVVHPNWRSGATGAKKDVPDPKGDAAPAAPPGQPQRGKFGSVGMWTGKIN
ncbi:MAG: FG-GAP repeat domain-containing protein [Candidatus Binatia bacterium]